MKSRTPPRLALGLTLLIVPGLILIALGILGWPDRGQRFGEFVSGPTLLFLAYIYYDIVRRRRSRHHPPASRSSQPEPPSQIKGRMPIKSLPLTGAKEPPRSAFLKRESIQPALTKTSFAKLAPAKPAAPKPSQAP
jgi:hypothetical protein